jgi:hypothetical protein
VHAVVKASRLGGGRVEREARLPHPARSGERDEALVMEQRIDAGHLALAPDEAGEHGGEPRRIARRYLRRRVGARRRSRFSLNDSPERIAYLGRAREAVAWLAGEQPIDQPPHAFGDIVRERPRGLVEHSVEDGHRALPRPRTFAGEHLVEHHPQRPQVGSRVDGITPHLLRRHVVWRPERVAGSRPVVARDLGDPEVHDLGHAVRGDEDVLGLDVAVNDASLVRRAEAIGDLLRDA